MLKEVDRLIFILHVEIRQLLLEGNQLFYFMC
jgi:hypothetical protein